MTDHDNRNSREIESEMEHTRSRVDETIHALENKLSPGELMDEALHYFRRSGSGEFASNFGETIKQNPMPVTLVGLGVGWLMVSGSRSNEHPTTTSSTYGASFPSTRSSSTSSHSSLDSARERTGAATDKAKDYAGDAQHKVKDVAGRAQGKAEDMADSAREKMHRMQSGSHASSERMSHNARRAQSQLSHIMHEQPLVVGALGIALGAALGAGLPSTDIEDEWMGETRDDVVGRAAETGRQQYEKAKSTAESAAQSAKRTAQHEADRKGLKSGQDSSTDSTGTSQSGGGAAIRNEPRK